MIDPADSHQLDGLLRRHRIELNHRLGQNFLTDPSVRDAVAEAAGITPDDEVLEVGAGVGTLTVALALRSRRLVAVELDGRLIPALRESLAGHDNVEVVRTDILRFNIRSAFPDGNEIVVGNIPYNLTGAPSRRRHAWTRPWSGWTCASGPRLRSMTSKPSSGSSRRSFRVAGSSWAERWAGSAALAAPKPGRAFAKLGSIRSADHRPSTSLSGKPSTESSIPNRLAKL